MTFEAAPFSRVSHFTAATAARPASTATAAHTVQRGNASAAVREHLTGDLDVWRVEADETTRATTAAAGRPADRAIVAAASGGVDHAADRQGAAGDQPHGTTAVSAAAR